MLNYKPLPLCLVLVAATGPAFAQLTLTQTHSVPIGGTAGPPDAADVAVLDLNEDGIQDIVTFNSDGIYTPPAKADFLAILLGNGDGTFQPYVETPEIGFTLFGSGEFRSRLMVGEFTGDTHPDLVLTHQGTQQVALIPNDGLGGFGTPILFDTGALVSSLHVADYNEDGLDDVLTVSLSGYNLSFLAGTGTGLAAPVGMASGLVSTHQPWTFDVADLDSDGHLDVLIPYLEDELGALVNEAIGFYGAGDGTFNMAAPVNITTGPVLASSRVNVQVGDVDADGYPDVVAVRDFYTGGVEDHVHVAYGSASGWGVPVGYLVSGQEWLTECVIADINFDGNLDIATICNGPFVLEVLLGDGARGFVGQGQIDVGGAAGMFAIMASDVTADQKLDIILGFHYSGHLMVYRNDTPGSALPGTKYCAGDGTGTLCPCANNNNGTMGGCDWGDVSFPGGGVLGAFGSDSMAANDTYLVATNIPNNFGVFFGANNQVNGGAGNPLNDGLRCAGGGLVRLIPPTAATGNQLTTPAPIQTLDTSAAVGVTRRYQYWFRSPGGPCSTTANLTNGFEIVWLN